MFLLYNASRSVVWKSFNIHNLDDTTQAVADNKHSLRLVNLRWFMPLQCVLTSLKVFAFCYQQESC